MTKLTYSIFWKALLYSFHLCKIVKLNLFLIMYHNLINIWFYYDIVNSKKTAERRLLNGKDSNRFQKATLSSADNTCRRSLRWEAELFNHCLLCHSQPYAFYCFSIFIQKPSHSKRDQRKRSIQRKYSILGSSGQKSLQPTRLEKNSRNAFLRKNTLSLNEQKAGFGN